MNCYKLLNADVTSRNGCAWQPDEWIEATAGLQGTSNPATLHGYTSQELAVLLNPVCTNIKTHVLYEAEYDGEVGCDGFKIYGRRMRIVGEPLPLPTYTMRGRVMFAIYAARLVLVRGVIPGWDEWADAYIGSEATWAESRAAGAAAKAAAKAAARTEDWAAWEAAQAAQAAALAAAWVAEAAAWVVKAARAAAEAAEAADATMRAEKAADAAARAENGRFDGFAFAEKLQKCAEEAKKEL